MTADVLPNHAFTESVIDDLARADAYEVSAYARRHSGRSQPSAQKRTASMNCRARPSSCAYSPGAEATAIAPRPKCAAKPGGSPSTGTGRCECG